MLRKERLHGAKAAARLDALTPLDVNYRLPPGSAPDWNHHWHLDSRRIAVAREAPGQPVPGGAFDIACRLVRDYQFPDRRILRALYRRDGPLLGRNMLLEGHFLALRFDLGVRVTSVIDETRGTGTNARRVWGWGYQTLEGHLEQGELIYEVIKHLRTGDVTFAVRGHSRRGPIANPVVRLGFVLFGRTMQHLFYLAAIRRLRDLVDAQLRGAPPLPVETVRSDERIAVAPSGG
ncbi:DUF1990 family protein [Streptomyces montanisoli]|uniref:DUF1990 family protein n=1 Tax=Streptomyces montanisoli TaxID=2798581 RepID=A0A940MDJ7_9ACTN|nr:DUF1990 family protein [Streptomyces montanisoli]MBP0457126.1 DUF1990 family protein [Streptomyces montanisoli]